MPDPALAFLNHCPSDLTKARSKLSIQILTVSKQTIVRAWKSLSLCILKTKNRITQAMIHSKIEATILHKILKHLKVWKPWVDYFLPSDFDLVG